ncbi:MAG: TIGR01777 family oxidoreductase [Kangiellaceae bacterium]|nr:TIGR01777 family oxidoreductase [Kangiellaceae bacterium]MCW9016813.1 TIGR01777 family oxidoreductase [Kangiellaceae bacterium]
MPSYFITGGTGLIGTALIESLRSTPARFTVLTRNISKAKYRLGTNITFVEDPEKLPSDSYFDFVINLAGEPIADKPWTTRRKLELWQSRIELTNHLVNWLHKLERPPKALISGSAVGWYGDGNNVELDESSPPHDEYTHQLCDAWEKAALKSVSLGTRVCVIRTGLVLSANGGFLKKLLLPFKLGLGARLGNGRQYMSWIHITDMVNAIRFLIEHGESSRALGGIFNLTAPNPVNNAEFTQTLAKQLNRPSFMVAPTFILETLLGEMSRLLLTGQRVIPKSLLEAGFEFKYQHLNQALENVLNS